MTSSPTSAEVAAGPIATKDRIAVLDVVRGFALLGILIMNVPGFSTSFYAEADGSHLWTSKIDLIAESARDMLFSGKFNSMFSLLFGLGFTIQLGRMMQKDPARAPLLYVRRLLVLAAFGLIHSMVFWNGDVLHIYAVLGFALLFLRNASNRTLYILIGLCMIIPTVNGLVRMATVTPDRVAQFIAEGQAWEASNKLAYGHGTFREAVREHTREFLHGYDNVPSLLRSLGFYSLMATTLFLGFLIGRNGLVQRIPELMPTIRKLQWRALVVGLILAAVFGVISALHREPGPSLWKIVRSNAFIFCRLAMMSFYILTIVRLAQLPAWQQRFAPIAAAGRMPLTNYLSQTLICTSLFYGWGFGFYYQMGPALGLVLALAIYFVIQVPLSVWWLRRFDNGPLEYLWRKLTYARPTASPAASPASA